MEKNLLIQEISVVVVAGFHNPTVLNPDFLKYNGIVPSEWDLAENPLCGLDVAQVKFKNEISILAQINKVDFIQRLASHSLADVCIPRIASKYLETLPHVDYKSIGMNPKGHVIVDSEEEAMEFVLGTLVADGPWKKFGKRQPKAVTRFVYTMEDDALLTITVEPAIFQQTQDKSLPVVLFTSNFHRDLPTDREKKIPRLKEVLDNWKQDVEIFQKLVMGIFLAQQKTAT
jgi:hypothetical protein